MPSALVWSVESVVLGLWALALAPFSTPLHVFIARSHVLISSFTAVLHLVVIARNHVTGPAVSQAFLCAVSALFLTYVFAVLDDREEKYFKLPSVGLLRLDAVIGLAWFTMAMLSGIGMALVKSHATAQKTTLMFHARGVHLVVIFPCILAIPPGWFRSVCVIVWLIHMVYAMVVILFESGFFKETSFSDLVLARRTKFILFLPHFVILYAAVVVSLLVIIFIDKGSDQLILIICLLGIAVVTSVGTISRIYFPSLPDMDGFLREPTKTEFEPSAPPKHLVVEFENTEPSAPPKHLVESRMPFLSGYSDPAAVLLHREKMV